MSKARSQAHNLNPKKMINFNALQKEIEQNKKSLITKELDYYIFISNASLKYFKPIDKLFDERTANEPNPYLDLLFAMLEINGIDPEQKDLFEYYEDQPEELQRVLKPYEEHDPTYESLKKILEEVQSIGFTFDYGLDAMPYNLRKM